MNVPHCAVFSHEFKITASVILVPVNYVKVLTLVLGCGIKHCIEQTVDNTGFSRKVLSEDSHYSVEAFEVNYVVFSIIKQIIKFEATNFPVYVSKDLFFLFGHQIVLVVQF